MSKSAPMASSLLTKTMRGTPYLVPWRQTVSVWGSTPFFPSRTVTAPSRTRSDRSTSTVVDVPGGVDDVDAMAVPKSGRGRARDRDAAFLLLDHPVHRGRAFVDLAHLVDSAGEVQNPLGRRRLSGVDVGHDPDVAGMC